MLNVTNLPKKDYASLPVFLIGGHELCISYRARIRDDAAFHCSLAHVYSILAQE